MLTIRSNSYFHLEIGEVSVATKPHIKKHEEKGVPTITN
jgi:hypothetical protein